MHTSTRVAWPEKIAKLTPLRPHAAPKGRGEPACTRFIILYSDDRPDAPDTVGVLPNAAIARKVSHAQAVDRCLAAPLILLRVQGIHLVLRRGIRGEIREYQE